MGREPSHTVVSDLLGRDSESAALASETEGEAIVGFCLFAQIL